MEETTLTVFDEFKTLSEEWYNSLYSSNLGVILGTLVMGYPPEDITHQSVTSMIPCPPTFSLILIKIIKRPTIVSYLKCSVFPS